MFRTMRRAKQQLSEEEAIRVLKEGKTAVLGLSGDNGYPYTVPVNYVYANGKIFFHCAKTGHKIDAIRNNAKVSLCVIEKDDVIGEKLATDYRSVILFGKAEILTADKEIFQAAEIFSLKYYSDKDFIDREIEKTRKALCCVKIEIDYISGKESSALARARGKERAPIE